LAGQIIGQLGGMALADIFNPGFDASVPILSQILYLTTLAIYVIIGGHRLLLVGLLSTLDSIPPGSVGLPTSIAGAMTTLLAESFSLGIRVAAPATVALLLATAVMGLISRTLPQLNILAFGFGLNALVTLALLSVSLGGMAWIFQEQLEPALETMLQALDSG
jgi:flagellar biosynthetic protein FliR